MGSEVSKEIIGEMCNFLQKKYLPPTLMSARQSGKTMTRAMYLEFEVNAMIAAVNVCAEIPFSILPLKINHYQLKVRDLVHWRLKRGV